MMTNFTHLLLSAWRHYTVHPIQSLLLILGVALGVALVVGVEIANESAKQSFALSTDIVVGKATHQIVGGSEGIPTELYEKLRIDLGYKQIAPLVAGSVQLNNADNRTLQLLGIDPVAERLFRNYLEDDKGQVSTVALAHLLFDPRGVIISENLAQQHLLAVDDVLTIVVEGRPQQVRLIGLLQTEDNATGQFLDDIMITDIGTAQLFLQKAGRIDSIDLILSEEDEEQAIAAILPPNARLQPAKLRTQIIEDLVNSFNRNLSAASLLTVLIGMFLIYNTVSFSIAQRRSGLGILRCLGVTREELFGLILIEAILLGLIGTILGIALGVVLSQGLVVLVSQTINDLFYTLRIQTNTIAPVTIYKAIGLGLGAAIVAAMIPAIEATTIPPYSTLQRSTQESRFQTIIPALTVTGGALFIVGIGLVYGATEQLADIGLLSVLVAFVLLTPMTTKILVTIVQPIMRWGLGISGHLASRDIIRALSRTSVAIVALMLAITIVIGFNVMITSFRQTIVAWLDSTYTADIYISPPPYEETLPTTLLTAIEQSHNQLEMAPRRDINVFATSYGELNLRAYTPHPQRTKPALFWSDTPDVPLGDEQIMISETFARHYNFPLNQPSTITLATDQGLRDFKIVGIFYDYEVPTPGYLLMPLSTYHTYWQDRKISHLDLYVPPEMQPQARDLLQQLRREFTSQYNVQIHFGEDIKSFGLTIFDRSFAITTALRLLAVIIAFIGIFSTLMSLQLERTRELSTLRAHGMSLRQLWAKVLLETTLMGLIAGIISLPAGFVWANILLDVITVRLLGWSLQLSFDPAIFVTALILSVGAALLAGIYPAFRLSVLNIAEGLREA
ncbi:MAG: FtsX-like permease family protein [Chloroflexota bacterium]